MSRKDKDKLLILGTFVGVILLVITFYFGSKVVPWYVIAIAVLVAEFGYFAPKVCKDYYELNKVKIGVSRWVPLYNELCMMEPHCVTATLVAGGAALTIFLVRFIPNTVIGSLFGIKAGMFWGYNTVPIFIMALVVLDIIFGIGLCKVFRQVNYMIFDYTKAHVAKIECIYYLLLLLPLVRVCAIAALYSKTQMLIKTGYGYQDDQKFTQQQEEDYE